MTGLVNTIQRMESKLENGALGKYGSPLTGGAAALQRTGKDWYLNRRGKENDQDKGFLENLNAPTEQPAPVVPPPLTMPIPDEQRDKMDQQRAYATRRQRGGRLSTILSDAGGTSDTLG